MDIFLMRDIDGNLFTCLFWDGPCIPGPHRLSLRIRISKL